MEKRQWTVPISVELDDAVEEAVKHNFYSTKAELIRSAVRKELERIGGEKK